MKQERVFFDIETGGLDPSKHPVIQLAAIAVDALTLKEIERKQWFVGFDEKAADPSAIAMNSYDPGIWQASSIPPHGVISEWCKFLRDHATVELTSNRGNPYRVARLVGHNAALFDGPFLSEWIKRELPGTFVPAELRVLDTYQLAMWHFEGREDLPRSFKLGILCDHFGIPLQAHDAMADVEATVELSRRIRQSYAALTD